MKTRDYFKILKIVFEDKQQQKTEELMNENRISPEVNIGSLDNVLDTAIRLNRAIQDIVVLRLFKLGIRQSSFPVVSDDF